MSRRVAAVGVLLLVALVITPVVMTFADASGAASEPLAEPAPSEVRQGVSDVEATRQRAEAQLAEETGLLRDRVHAPFVDAAGNDRVCLVVEYFANASGGEPIVTEIFRNVELDDRGVYSVELGKARFRRGGEDGEWLTETSHRTVYSLQAAFDGIHYVGWVYGDPRPTERVRYEQGRPDLCNCPSRTRQ